MIVKVCGMRDPLNIRGVESTGVDWMGFIFYPRSSRYVPSCPGYLPQKAVRVGVFVDASAEFILERVEEYSLGVVQLHGSESPETVRQIRGMLPSCVLIMKAFNILDPSDLEYPLKYEGLADYFLFDTKTSLKGGSGLKFDWDILSHYKGEVPFLLSGGIGPEDADAVLGFSHPKFAGIDLNSRFETSPAVKDTVLVSSFLDKLSHSKQTLP